MVADRSKDRHKARHLVPIPADIYDLLQQLAEKRGEPTVAALVRTLALKTLAAEGMLAQPKGKK